MAAEERDAPKPDVAKGEGSLFLGEVMTTTIRVREGLPPLGRGENRVSQRRMVRCSVAG